MSKPKVEKTPQRKPGAAKPRPEPKPGEALRKKDLIDRVAAASGAKPGDVKKVVEATLALLAEHLGRDEDLTLPPLGKLTVARRKETGKGEVLTLKLRRGGAGVGAGAGAGDGAEKSGKEPLAATDE